MAKVNTAVMVTPILYHEKTDIKGETKIPQLNKLLAAGYRIKIVNNFEYNGVMYVHYILEKESE